MPNSFINFCYNIAGKREDMEANQPEPKNPALLDKEKLKRDMIEAARKRARNIKLHNDAVKYEAKRGVRRPGPDHTWLFQVLDQLIGSVEVKKEVIYEVIEEALRFKRRALAQLLKELIVKLEMKRNRKLNEKKICRHCLLLRARAPRSCGCKSRTVG